MSEPAEGGTPTPAVQTSCAGGTATRGRTTSSHTKLLRTLRSQFRQWTRPSRLRPPRNGPLLPADTPIPMPEASLPQEVTTASSVAQSQVAPIPMPSSPVDEENNDEADAPERSGTLKWVLACAASWVLVAVFITVLVIAWSRLGASGRIQEDAKSRAETAQNELDTARSTLDSINQQLKEASK